MNNITVLACHVNDCTITRSSQALIQEYKNKLKQKYLLTDLGAANWLLGIEITRDFKVWTISFSQSSYIDAILMRFNFTDLKLLLMPMDPSIHFLKDQCPQTPEEIADMCNIPYCEAISLLNYSGSKKCPNVCLFLKDQIGVIFWHNLRTRPVCRTNYNILAF